MEYSLSKGKQMKTKLTRELFVRKLSRKARFTKADTRALLDAMNEVIYDLARAKKEELENSDETEIHVVNLYGLFDIKIVKIKPHKGFDALRNREIELGVSYKIIATPSKVFKYYINDYQLG